MQPIKEFGLLALLAAFYFFSVFFAVAALAPSLALASSFIAAMPAMGVYLILTLTRRDEPGLPLGLLILAPIICIAAGVLWWVLQLLGLWRVN